MDDGLLKAVDQISFEIKKGRVLGIVGESGSGKTVTALALMNLLNESKNVERDGEIWLEGRNISDAKPHEWEEIRGEKIAMVFQDPMTSLNPFLSVGRQLSEVLEAHGSWSKKDILERVLGMLEQVGFYEPKKRLSQYPHELSGGMRQRIMLAMALLCKPRLLIADEPTTALDVTTQTQVLQLLLEQKQKTDMSILLVSHDLGVVAGVADDVAVMYAGKMVEMNSCEELFSNPRHPYTKALLRSIPKLHEKERGTLETIAGTPPSLTCLPQGCSFHPRCSLATKKCQEEVPTTRFFDPFGRVDCWEVKI